MKHQDPFELIRDRNPVPDAHQLPDGPKSASAEALFEEIIGMTDTRSKTRPRGSKKVVLLAAAILVLGATAAVAAIFGEGNLPEPAFSGDTWALIVGEGANDEAGTVYKVCHHFAQPEGSNEANGLGTAGCEVVSLSSSADSVFVEIVPAVGTPAGVVLFVDLTIEPVAMVSVLLDDGSVIEVAPLRMPQSGKQFAAIEIADDATQSVTVRALDSEGNVMESREVTDLTVTD